MSMINYTTDDPQTSRASLASRFAVESIKGYRKWISPRKGFKCASGAMGLQSCSTIGLENFQNYPLWDAIQKQRKALGTCIQMSEILKLVEDCAPDEATHIVQMQYGKTKEDAEYLVLMASNENKKKKERRSSSQGSTRSCDGFDGFDAACCSLAILADMS